MEIHSAIFAVYMISVCEPGIIHRECVVCSKRTNIVQSFSQRLPVLKYR
jgi:hypothetical protein